MIRRRSYCTVRGRCNRGMSFLELIMVLVILGIIGSVVLARLPINSLDSKKNACYTNRRSIEVQAELWYRNKGTWPAADLSDMGTDPAYFPDGLPTCPVDGTAYVLDGITHQVSGHDHPPP